MQEIIIKIKENNTEINGEIIAKYRFNSEINKFQCAFTSKGFSIHEEKTPNYNDGFHYHFEIHDIIADNEEEITIIIKKFVEDYYPAIEIIE